MHSLCETCQACEPPHQPLKLKVMSTPIPPHIMTSVAIDLFVMPEVEQDGGRWNVFAACVDRHSGWCVATMHHTKGLTAAKVAKEMYAHWWSPHGLPSILTSDRGPHFAGAWWRTMCALHGVRQGFAQAYHHEGNGRAERIGSQLQVRLRKLQAEESITWVESLQRAVRLHNDSPGPSGLSPYEILYGRHRPMAGVPYEPERMAEDAIAFFDRQAKVDAQVAKVMDDIHDKRNEQLNRRRRELQPLSVESKVWYLRPRGRPGEKLETYWIGPCSVKERRGEHSYVIELEPGRLQEAHRSQLKQHFDDAWIGKPLKMFHYRQAVQDMEAAPDEWNVEGIDGHRAGKDGYPEFCVRWEGSSERTWEPLRHFFHRYSHPVLEYCLRHDLRIPDLIDYLYKNRPEAIVNEVKWEAPPEDWAWPDEGDDEGSIENFDDHIATQGEGDRQDQGERDRRVFQGVLAAASRSAWPTTSWQHATALHDDGKPARHDDGQQARQQAQRQDDTRMLIRVRPCAQ